MPALSCYNVMIPLYRLTAYIVATKITWVALKKMNPLL